MGKGDRNPSLKVVDGENSGLILFSFAGCAKRYWIAAPQTADDLGVAIAARRAALSADRQIQGGA